MKVPSHGSTKALTFLSALIKLSCKTNKKHDILIGRTPASFLSWQLPAYFSFLRLFQSVDRKQMFNVNFADDWIRAADLWYRKQLFYLCSDSFFHLRSFQQKIYRIN